MQNSNLLTKIMNNTQEKMIKFFKTKRYIIHLMIILPFTAISYVQYLFNHQRIEVYGKNAFITEMKLLFSYGDKNDNFDVYILDRNHEIDFIFFHGASILEEKYKKRLEFLFV